MRAIEAFPGSIDSKCSHDVHTIRSITSFVRRLHFGCDGCVELASIAISLPRLEESQPALKPRVFSSTTPCQPATSVEHLLSLLRLSSHAQSKGWYLFYLCSPQ
jgi:hypothetical protein